MIVGLADPHEVLHVEDPDDVIEIVDEDRVARGGRRLDLGGDGGSTGIVFDRLNLTARRHQFIGGEVLELEDVTDDLALELGELAPLGRLVGDDGQLLGAVERQRLVGFGDAEQSHERQRHPIEECDRRPEEEAESPHHSIDPQARTLGLGQRQSLRDHLAEHDVQVRDDAECHDESDRVRGTLGQSERLERVVQPVGDGGLAVHTETDRGESDAELGHGDVAVLAGGTVEDSEEPTGTTVAVVRQCVDT